MRLKHLIVRNFRGLESIDVHFDALVNVIAGPNAIGKTTVLEAIRLTKALLSPRTQHESQQVLLSLGAAVVYNPQRIYPQAIARDSAAPVEIHAEYELEDFELQELSAGLRPMATRIALSSMGLAFGNPSASIPFLSSPQGNAILQGVGGELAKWAESIQARNANCILGLSIDPSGRVTEADPFSAAAISFLEEQLRPNITKLSYFPADRALPFGEQQVQLGAADATQQLEAHLSQPQLKYSRLKNTIFGAVVASPDQRKDLEAEFERIFEGTLKSKRFVGAGINERGLLSIRVEDIDTGRKFDLDAMSSGEKGLVLTFLLIGQSLARGGLILLDEPELHLNPAVCKNLLSFLVTKYVVPKGLQAIICSHSPQILAGAFEKDECSLFHLKSGTMLTKVRRRDETEIAQILRRLGSSESEALLYKGTVFVEGDDDVDLLDIGVGDLLRTYKVRQLGGRREIEKQIAALQKAENTDATLPSQYFIFDRDESLTDLKSSDKVRVLQWGRRCLENYLLDVNVLTDLLQQAETAKSPVTSLGEVEELLRSLALSQLDELVAKETYQSYLFEGAGIRTTEIRNKTFREMADIQFARFEKIKIQVCGLEADWKDKFVADCQRAKTALENKWSTSWLTDCDGKRLFQDLHQRVQLQMSTAKFKARIMSELRSQGVPGWLDVHALISRLLQ